MYNVVASICLKSPRETITICNYVLHKHVKECVQLVSIYFSFRTICYDTW